jgi:hypothetical protein
VRPVAMRMRGVKLLRRWMPIWVLAYGVS